MKALAILILMFCTVTSYASGGKPKPVEEDSTVRCYEDFWYYFDVTQVHPVVEYELKQECSCTQDANLQKHCRCRQYITNFRNVTQ
jgi:uncharacterized protein YchJ